MTNKKIIDIFEATKAKLPTVPSFTPPSDARERMRNEFLVFCLNDDENETILTYRDISNDGLSQILAEISAEIEIPTEDGSDIPDIRVQNNCKIVALTDQAIYFYHIGGDFRLEWEEILSVTSKESLYIFHVMGDIRYAVPDVCLCETEICQVPAKNALFVKMLNDMAQVAKSQAAKITEGANALESSLKMQEKYYKEGNADKKHNNKETSKTDKPISKPYSKISSLPIDGNYTEIITEQNLGEILSAGKPGEVDGVDLSALSKLNSKEDELTRAKCQALEPSELGSTQDIAAKKDILLKRIKGLEPLQKQFTTAKRMWETDAYPLFIAATHANTRIVLGSSGYSIAQGRNNEKLLPGVYTVSVPVAGKEVTAHLPEEVAQDIKAKTDSLSKKWIEYLDLNTEVWEKVAEITGNQSMSPKSTPEDLISTTRSKLDDAYIHAQKYEQWQKKIKSLESEISKLRSQKDAVMKVLNLMDPILTSFNLPTGQTVYTQEWLNRVKKVAESRKSMPYLPLYWSDKSFGTVFNWQKAIDAGKPNLFIEASTDEGDYGRVDMLDNFIATMLLAFPVRDIHFTVIEQNRSNTFVTNLPKKLCDIYSIDGDSEAINSTANRLNEILRNERGSSASGARPREIVVFIGFRRKDQKFAQVMERFREPIEKGKLAGIYFAVVLDEDMNNYDWKDTDANRFEQYFTPYSTILTDKKDSKGNPIPDYKLLKNKAEYLKEEKLEKGTLADMVTNYLVAEAASVPNKVYEFIENGTLYTNKLISDLDDQPRKDVGKLVIPIAEDGEDNKINMVLDDQAYMFYFILGMTGSGKSFTLHTILTNLMLKYDPSILDVVIMDFKGGVEMADYRGVPHVSSILANGADAQVAGEMLMSLNKEMTRRDELFTQSGTKNISEYNRYAVRNGNAQMKNIIFLVDECQDLFKIDRPINSSEFIAMLAKKGRIYGIHMILATQTLKNSGIPKDALSQFSDFIFMKCAPDDVNACGINNRDLQMNVAKLNKGEMYYCHGQEDPIHGYVYNYAGKGNIYKEKTLENLKGKRFPRPAKEQFYFDSAQIFKFDDVETKQLVSKAKSGLRTTSTAALGKNLSVNLDTLYAKLGKGDGSNLLVVGANDRLQGERVLWNAVQSLYECNHAIGQGARYYIIPNIPEDVDASALMAHEKRLAIVKSLSDKLEVTLVEDDERADTIERVAATVRGRMHLVETDKKAIDKLDAIYLVIPNQQMFAKNMGRRPKGLDSLDSDLHIITSEPNNEQMAAASSASASDSLGFVGLNMPGSEPATPVFADIDFGSFDSQASKQSTANQAAVKPGRNYDEELRYILEYGPGVNVHVLLQTTAPDKIYSGDAMREKEMTLLFNDIILLKMMQASTMSLPVDGRVIEKLSAEPKSLRAIAYNGEREPRTIVPFDFS